MRRYPDSLLVAVADVVGDVLVSAAVADGRLVGEVRRLDTGRVLRTETAILRPQWAAQDLQRMVRELAEPYRTRLRPIVAPM